VSYPSGPPSPPGPPGPPSPPEPAGPPDPQGTPGAPSAAVPTCFRHPGRETYVSCSRCGRPACPDCLRSAPVGQQCVECIREGSRTVRRPVGLFGGSPQAGRPLVTWTLIAVNVVLWLYEFASPAIANSWAMIGIGVADGQWYRLITSAFLPPPGLSGLGFLDIVFNMWALLLVGPGLEQALGRVRFLAIYLVSAIGGSVAFYFLARPDEAALGASGAIFGLFAAWFVLSRRLRVDSRQVVALIVINLVIGFVFATAIAWQAHVGGLIAGGALTAAFVYAPRRNRVLVQAGVTVAILALLIIGVIIRDNTIAGTVRL
jgi:membrane associated rhomboid family serine protease